MIWNTFEAQQNVSPFGAERIAFRSRTRSARSGTLRRAEQDVPPLEVGCVAPGRGNGSGDESCAGTLVEYTDFTMHKKVIAPLFVLLLTLLPMWVTVADAQIRSHAPRVAVFFEPGFPYYGVSTQISPQQIVLELRASGVQAELLGEDALSDTDRFNARTFAALVLPYGNTYPQVAFASMRAYHRAGGALILSGIPFTHPVVRAAAGKWSDLGHNNEAALFGKQGIGVGGFTGSEQDKSPTAAPGNALGLASLSLNWSSYAHEQRLDPVTIPAGDELIPVVGAANRPVIALLIHRIAPYKGAVDVWTAHGPEGDLQDWITKQLLLRGTVVALERKGLLSSRQRQTAFASFARLPKPPVYSSLVLPTIPRPYPTFQPKMPPPARHLDVVDVSKCTRDERILLLSLQGIVNRKQPRLYLLLKEDDRFWLDEMRRHGDTDEPVTIADPLSVVSRYRSSVQGAVVPDPKVYLSPCVAACVAGADDLLIATPELAQRLHLPIKADLRGKFKGDAEALHSIRKTLLPRMNPYLACCLDPSIFDTGALDQIIAAKGIVFWITGTKAQHLPGADGSGELAEVKALLAAMPLNAVVRGFWWHGEDIGINEGAGVSLASRFGKVTVVSDYVANFSVFSGVPQTMLKQKPQNPPPTLDKSKVYFSFTMSDGDNLCTWRDYFRTYFQDPLHGTIPIGWGMGPSLLDNAPVWARWYYDHATANDEFLCDVSGVGYIYGPDWATALKDRNAAFAEFYGWTEQYMRQMDMHTIRLMNVDTPDIAQAARLMPNVRFLMPDYGSPGGLSYSRLTYDLPNDQTVFRAVTGADAGSELLTKQIRERVGAARPAFLNVFIWNWGSKLSDLKRIQERLGPEYIAVTPSQLDFLHRQANTPQAK